MRSEVRSGGLRPMEIWRDITGYEGLYKISSLGASYERQKK